MTNVEKHIKSLEGSGVVALAYLTARVKKDNPKTAAAFNKVVDEFAAHFKVDADDFKMVVVKKPSAKKAKSEPETNDE